MLKLDLHVHTVYSLDATIRPREAILWARRAGLDGLAITDHNTLAGARKAERLASRYGLLVLPGMEIETRGGHILVLCPTEPIRPSDSLGEVIDAAIDADAITVLAHPYSLLAPRKWSPSELKRVDAIEVVNAKDLLFEFSCRMARRLALSLRKPMTGGSDAHVPEAIGAAYTLVEAESEINDAIRAIRKGRTKPLGSRVGLRCLIKKWAHAL
ncbi:MAG TPA: PHP domain-containing protein [Candidatus Bathyarchaeota archaeon]|nr:PHP domain-containing protein [Candidatus Bathyarchaeota archaeon]